jgi:uncharacterized RDD family membrane protein YckC
MKASAIENTINERYTIDTPEHIQFSYTIAGIGSRFLAAIIDTFLLVLIQTMLLALVFFVLSTIENAMSSGMESLVTALWAILSFVFLWGYYIFFEFVWNGQTPGKRLIKLRVVREGGRPITFAASTIRNLIRIVDFLPGLYGLGVLVMFIDKRARRLGDLAGGTLVVKDRLPVSLDSLVAQAEQTLQRRQQILSTVVSTSPDGSTTARLSTFTPTIPNLHEVTSTDYNLAQEFLRRRHELGQQSRRQIGWQLATGISSRLGFSVEAGYYEQFLEHIVQEYHLLHESQQHLAR